MKWVFEDGIPIYQQIVRFLRVGIANGTYPPGSKLPAVRDLAMEAGVNPNTMQRALAELERRGLVFSERTSGRFVTKEDEVLKALHEDLAKKYFEELADKLHKIGMSGEEIAGAVKRWLDDIK